MLLRLRIAACVVTYKSWFHQYWLRIGVNVPWGWSNPVANFQLSRSSKVRSRVQSVNQSIKTHLYSAICRERIRGTWLGLLGEIVSSSISCYYCLWQITRTSAWMVRCARRSVTWQSVHSTTTWTRLCSCSALDAVARDWTWPVLIPWYSTTVTSIHRMTCRRWHEHIALDNTGHYTTFT